MTNQDDRAHLDGVYARLSPTALAKVRTIVADAPPLTRDQEMVLTRALGGGYSTSKGPPS